MSDFESRGYKVFPPETAVADWASEARQDARRALGEPDLAHWYQCEGTWFVGLEALENDKEGRVGVAGPLRGAAVDYAAKYCGGWPDLHKAQVSGVFPGYPRPRAGENDAAFRYRQKRHAAHVDGVIGKGRPKRRFVEEPHAFILGLPLTEADAGAAPLMVWEGSHRIMQRAFHTAFAGASGDASQVDVTDVYKKARAEAFDKCRLISLCAPPGAAILLHRLLLHGVGAWSPGAKAAPEGRLIAYFRPPMPGGPAAWAEAA